MPALEYEQGKGIFDSNIINVYLDEKYPEVPLQSTDPLRRAQDKMLVENFAAVCICILSYKMYANVCSARTNDFFNNL